MLSKKNALIDDQKFFKLLNNSWNTKKQTSDELLNNKELFTIDNILDNDKTVIFHKLCGAGGGGYYLIITDELEYPDDYYKFFHMYEQNYYFVLLNN